MKTKDQWLENELKGNEEFIHAGSELLEYFVNMYKT